MTTIGEMECGYHPDGVTTCGKPTTTIAIGATNELGMFYLPVCTDCALLGNGWTIAYPYDVSLHD